MSAPAAPAARPPSVRVVVPVKPPAVGKSRLAGLDRRAAPRAGRGLRARHRRGGSRHRPAWRRSWWSPTTSGSPAAMRALGCEVIPDGASEDLNATLVQAAARSYAVGPTPCRSPCAPTCRGCGRASSPGSWTRSRARGGGVRRSCATGPASGTTLYAAAAERFDPSFGVGSAARHARPAPSRSGRTPRACGRDVDDLADLGAALVAGVGPHTPGQAEGGPPQQG